MKQLKQTKPLYAADLYKWAKTQVKFLKRNEIEKVDMEHIIEEIEDLAKSERKALKSQLIRLLMHLLKYKYQPVKRSKSWDKTIGNSRIEVEDILKENPSLRRELSAIMEEAYSTARKKAANETGLDLKKFPAKCPWSLKETLNS